MNLDRQSMITTVRVEAQVNRPLALVAPLIAPESWALAPCFKAIYRVRCDRTGIPIVERSAGQCVFEVDPVAPTATIWTGIYYEHIEAGMPGGGSAEFHNLLDIQFERSDSAAQLRYNLNQCVSSRWGTLRRSGGIDVDRGHTRLERRGERMTYLEAVKSIRYTPFQRAELGALNLFGVDAHALNRLAPTFLGPWMEQLVLGACTVGLSARDCRTSTDAAEGRAA